ncbi:acyltransferase [Rhizobium halophilum]|uniref:acyltransferase n=1 Tax=Rhizobium halophilum TaxID=2846852 RepID=UPI001EFDFD97|nr:acyltransferase [Rhizobium halophilum]MCF6369492.1 acyltransferase [Rhizobium halophilum]
MRDDVDSTLEPISPEEFPLFPGLVWRSGAPEKLSLQVSLRMREYLKLGKARISVGIRPEVKHAAVTIGSFTRSLSLSFMSGESTVEVGMCGHLEIEATLYDNSSVIIGDNTTCNSARFIAADADIEIGSDCMFSHGIVLQACDQHGIIDLRTQEIINLKRGIVIEDHVWLGKQSFICPGCKLGTGSIVGAMSTVSKDIAPFSLVAGSPANIIRSNVSWSRHLDAIDRRTAGFLRANAPRFRT